MPSRLKEAKRTHVVGLKVLDVLVQTLGQLGEAGRGLEVGRLDKGPPGPDLLPPLRDPFPKDKSGFKSLRGKELQLLVGLQHHERVCFQTNSFLLSTTTERFLSSWRLYSEIDLEPNLQ